MHPDFEKFQTTFIRWREYNSQNRNHTSDKMTSCGPKIIFGKYLEQAKDDV
jgi:hypothetical protein